MDVTDEGDESRGSEETDSWDGHEPLGYRVIPSEGLELSLDTTDSRLERGDFLAGGGV